MKSSTHKLSPAVLIFLLMPMFSFGYNEAPQQLTSRQLRNLVAFSKLYGYLRFYYPSEQALEMNWDPYTTEGIRAVENSVNDEELIRNLEQWGHRVAPLMQINEQPQIPHISSGEVKYWWHLGFGGYGFKEAFKESDYKSVVKQVDVSKLHNAGYFIPPPDSVFSFVLADGITAYMPISLYVTKKNAQQDTTKIPSNLSPGNRSARLAVVVVVWNILRHFYPYWDVVKTDWDKTLNETLSRASQDKGTYEDFGITLAILISAIRDGHASLYFKSDDPEAQKQYYPVRYGYFPIKPQWVEGKTVVANCTNCDSLHIKKGDIIAAINGYPVDKLVAHFDSMNAGANPNHAKYYSMQYVQSLPLDSAYTFTFIDSEGNAYQKTFVPGKWVDLEPERLPPLTEVKKGIYYADLTQLTNKQLNKAMHHELRSAQGIIFDVRGYPYDVAESFLSHLITAPVTSPKWMTPVRTVPETVTFYDTSGRWTLKPKPPLLHGKIVFLTNERAISYAESVMGIVEHYKIGEIVGVRTAGTNGEVAKVDPFESFRMVFTGMKVLKNDGSQHHGIGIIPTVPCDQTIQGLRHGKDDQLEKAISVIERR